MSGRRMEDPLAEAKVFEQVAGSAFAHVVPM
jgi:hypothetical protein